jgi:hypothetical protein
MIIHGVQVNIGIGNVVNNVNGIFQTRDHHIIMESKDLNDGGGTTVAKAYWNYHEEATFTYVAYGFGGQVSAQDLPTIGRYVSVNTISLFALPNTNYYPVTGNNWKVDDVQVNSSNVAATRVTLKLSRHPANTFPPI